MSIYDLIVSRRTIRAFEQKTIERNILEKLVNAARLAPSAANKQPLEYIIVDDKNICSEIFSNIRLAGLLEWKPTKEIMPQAYIAILVNKEIRIEKWYLFDVACSAENICLAALTYKLGSCMIGAFDEKGIRNTLNVPEEYDIALLTALGFPAQNCIVEDLGNEEIKYWRDDKGIFHVPKRKLEDIIHYNQF